MARQSPVTVRARILPGRVAAVRDLLEGGSPDDTVARLGLAGLPGLHFARLFVIDSARLQSGRVVPESLVYMADVDGPADCHLRLMAGPGHPDLHLLFAQCEGYPAGSDSRARLRWLRSHSLAPAARYVHTVGRTVDQVRDETRLYHCLGQVVDGGAVPVEGAAPPRLRADLREAVTRLADLAWAGRRPPGPRLVEEVRDGVQLTGGLALLLAAAPVLVPAGAVWLLLLRAQERRDTQEEGAPDQRHVEEVRRYEDVATQNPFTAIGEIKPGVVRRVTMRVALAGLDFACRHAFSRDNLSGVDSIHFARWVLLDDNQRLVFASSYDGSLESYMDDFISRLWWGINLVFSNGVGFPRARWLVFGGARDEISYKHYLRRHQIATPVYYSAYSDRTARNLDTFSAVRAGLCSRDDGDAAEWLARL
jgi:hypothetical protein